MFNNIIINKLVQVNRKMGIQYIYIIILLTAIFFLPVVERIVFF